MISCIIPAAGLSSRMNEWKIMLPYQGRPIIDLVLETALSAADRVILVIGHRSKDLRNHFAGNRDITFIENINYTYGMFSSIRAGVAELENELFFILHADLPLIKKSHIIALLDYFTMQRENSIEIVQPLCGTVPGHPVIFSESVKETILASQDSDTMRDVFKAHAVSFFPTDDPAYITDIDTIESYNKLIDES
jgi:molybdenum cofactor cytidylyltransferase